MSFNGKLEEIKRKLVSFSILKDKAQTGENIMEISIQCAHEGVTTGEWSDTMRDVFGEYRAPTGIVSSRK